MAFPVSKIINSSFKEQRLPKIWKFADVSPLPKVKPVEDLKKHLRPISCLLKVAEECVVVDYLKSTVVLNVLDPSQYGAVPKSSTTQALIQMLHHWTERCDGNGATFRVTLYDYKKAFDPIDHRILVNKLCKLDLQTEMINWIIDFLSDRSQRINSQRDVTPSGDQSHQGTPGDEIKLGPWLFLVLINELEINSAGNIWKYIDDTTTSEIVVKGASSSSQLIADTIAQWSFENRVKLNNEKCKELRISFAKNKPQLAAIVVNNQELECVERENY